MKREDRANGPAPAVTSIRENQPDTCEQCGGALHAGVRFCSHECFGISRRKQAKHGPISIELLNEMQEALDALRTQIREAG